MRKKYLKKQIKKLKSTLHIGCGDKMIFDGWNLKYKKN